MGGICDRDRYDGYTKSYTPPPKYNRTSDRSLEKVDPVMQAKKQSLIDQLEIAKAAYKQEKDKNTGRVFWSIPTVIIPLAYYGIKGAVMGSLPYNRRKQCERLIEVVKAIGTKDYLGECFLRKEFQELFQLLKSGKSKKLMSLLVEAYQLNQEATKYPKDSFLEPVDRHIRFFTKSKLAEHLPISDIANLVLEYSKEVPKVPTKEATAAVEDEKNTATLS